MATMIITATRIVRGPTRKVTIIRGSRNYYEYICEAQFEDRDRLELLGQLYCDQGQVVEVEDCEERLERGGGLLLSHFRIIEHVHESDYAANYINLFALKPLRSLLKSLAVYEEGDTSSLRALYELFFNAEKLVAIVGHSERVCGQAGYCGEAHGCDAEDQVH